MRCISRGVRRASAPPGRISRSLRLWVVMTTTTRIDLPGEVISLGELRALGLTRAAAAGGRYSMPSGPREAPDRNCRTNMLSELNSSSAGPDSTIRPFHSTLMCSATRLADMMSWVMTT